MIERNKLKPCPFCGGEAHLEHSRVEMSGRTNADIVTTWNVRCANCGTEKRGLASHYVIGDDEVLRLVDDAFMDGRIFAITQWNRRADREQSGDMVEVVRCKDCVNRIEFDTNKYHCEITGYYCGETAYCSDGVRERMKGGAE